MVGMKKTIHIQMDVDSHICRDVDEICETIKNVVESETDLEVTSIGQNYPKELELELLLYFSEYMTQHPEMRNKSYIYRNQQVWTPQDIYDKLVADKLFYKRFEKDLLMLAIDLIMRNREQIDSFTIRVVQ